MSRLLLSAFILLIISIALFSLDNSKKDYYHSWTKAICFENKCQDFLIYCNKNQLLKMEPISSLVVFDNFEDLRENRELC